MKETTSAKENLLPLTHTAANNKQNIYAGSTNTSTSVLLISRQMTRLRCKVTECLWMLPLLIVCDNYLLSTLNK